jgi:hypothetical protein
MDFLINETQLKIILQEQDESKMTDYMKELYSFTRDIVNKVGKKYKINLNMLLTWGASIGGLMMPLDNYVRKGNFKITEFQILLIVLGVASFLFFENKRLFNKIYDKIKKDGIEDVFDQVLSKGIELKEAFLNFLSSSNIAVSSFMDAASYAFLVPIIDDIHSIANNSKNLNEAAKLITERLILSGVISVASTSLYAIIKKLLKKFKR